MQDTGCNILDAGYWMQYTGYRVLDTGYWILELSIYKFGLGVCLSVCLYPLNVKTADPNGPKFVVGPHVTPGKV